MQVKFYENNAVLTFSAKYFLVDLLNCCINVAVSGTFVISWKWREVSAGSCTNCWPDCHLPSDKCKVRNNATSKIMPFSQLLACKYNAKSHVLNNSYFLTLKLWTLWGNLKLQPSSIDLSIGKVNVARSSFEISLQRPLWWKVWFWLADKQKTQKTFFSHMAGSLAMSVYVACQWLGVAIGISLTYLFVYFGGQGDILSSALLPVIAFLCQACGRAISSASESAVFCCILMHVPLHVLLVLMCFMLWVCLGWLVFLLPGFEVVSSSPQVPRHPTSKCDSDVNCLAH